MVVHHTVLLSPPIQGRHEEDKAEHPPSERNFHTVEFPEFGNVDDTTLRSLLLQSVPQDELHHLTVLWPMHTRSSQFPSLRNRCSGCIRHRPQCVAISFRHSLPTSDVLF